MCPRPGTNPGGLGGSRGLTAQEEPGGRLPKRQGDGPGPQPGSPLSCEASSRVSAWSSFSWAPCSFQWHQSPASLRSRTHRDLRHGCDWALAPAADQSRHSGPRPRTPRPPAPRQPSCPAPVPTERTSPGPAGSAVVTRGAAGGLPCPAPVGEELAASFQSSPCCPMMGTPHV